MPNPKAELAAMLEAREKLRKERLFYQTFPDEGPLRRELYPKHMEFIGDTRNYSECALISANQIGKCASVSSYVRLPDGSRKTFGELYAEGTWFSVNAWDGRKVVQTLAMPPIKKPKEPCVRLWFADGSWFECALNHRVLLESGDYVFVSEVLSDALPLQESVDALLESTSGTSQSIHVASDRHLLGRLPSFLAGCLASLRFCDARLHSLEVFCQAFLPQSIGGRVYNFALYGQGENSSTYTSNPQPTSSHPSNLDVMGRSLGRFSEFLFRGLYNACESLQQSIQDGQKLLLGLTPRPLPSSVTHRRRALLGAYSFPYISGNQIIAYESIESQEVYDFSVPKYANYVTNGIVHHNTRCAAFFVSACTTGDYPSWWHGKRWEGPIDCWCAGDTNETVRNIIQNELLGPPEAPGTGMIPAKFLGDIKKKSGSVADAVESFTVNHVNGGVSKIAFKAYEQKRKSFQGTKKHLIWLDEEPPEDVYAECFTRTANTDGIIICTFTPLNGISDIVLAFMEEEYGDHRE